MSISNRFTASSRHAGSDDLLAAHPTSSSNETDPTVAPFFFEFVSCHICGHDLIDTQKSDEPDRFWMTDCGHFLCDNHHHVPGVCTQCGKKPIQTYKLTKDLDPALKIWFKNPTKAMTSATRTVGFQITEMARVISHQRDQIRVQNRALQQADQQIQKTHALREELRVTRNELQRLRSQGAPQTDSSGSSRLQAGQIISDQSSARQTCIETKGRRQNSMQNGSMHDSQLNAVNGEASTGYDLPLSRNRQSGNNRDDTIVDGFGQPLDVATASSRKRLRVETPHGHYTSNTPLLKSNGPFDSRARYDDRSDDGRGLNNMRIGMNSSMALREHVNNYAYRPGETNPAAQQRTVRQLQDSRTMPPPLSIPQRQQANVTSGPSVRPRSVMHHGSDPIQYEERISRTPLSGVRQSQGSLQRSAIVLAGTPRLANTPRPNRLNREPFYPSRNRF